MKMTPWWMPYDDGADQYSHEDEARWEEEDAQWEAEAQAHYLLDEDCPPLDELETEAWT